MSLRNRFRGAAVAGHSSAESRNRTRSLNTHNRHADVEPTVAEVCHESILKMPGSRRGGRRIRVTARGSLMRRQAA